MGGAKSIAVEYELPQSPDKVWRALTGAEILSRWRSHIRDRKPQELAKL